MKNSILISLVVLTGFQFSFATEPNRKTIGTIHIESPELIELIADDATVEVLVEGLDWCEGPVWLKDSSYLLFNDIPRNTTYKWTEQNGLELFLRPSGYSLGSNPPGMELGGNGMFINPTTGQLTMCDHGNRCLVALNQENWTKLILADRFEEKRFNSPNDLAINSTGHIYFTDPPYGLTAPDFRAKELDFCGVYHRSPDGKITLVTKELDRPNGIGLSPDERTLYVANSGDQKIWLAIDLKEDGSVGESRIFYDATEFKKYGKLEPCDGMAVDSLGNLWATGPGGVMIFNPNGKLLGSIETGTSVSNCCFGGASGNELFITADMYLCRIKVKAKGIGF